ncbi:MAG: M48 family metalloprotease [Gemmatimonadota bacterium]
MNRNHPFRPTTARTLRTSAALALALGLASCATNPATGETELSLVSESQEIAIGRQSDPEIVASMGLYPDEELQEYVSAIGNRLAAVSERPELPWTFRVIDDPTVNAFAVPGGFIYFTRGILGYMVNEAQLATVMGHEIGHVTARHSAAQMTRQQLATAGLALGSVLSQEVASVAGLAQQSLGLLFLKFGRDDETQSDELAFRYMRRTDYDVREAPGMFEMLRRISAAQGGGRIPEWQSTHPDPGNRRDRAAAAIAELDPSEYGSIVDRAEFLRMIDGVVYGPDPREGYFRDQRFIHPELAFELTFPDGWRTRNQKQAVLALSPGQDAILQLTLADGSPGQAAQSFLAQQGIEASSPQRRDVNGLPAVVAEFRAQTQEGVLLGAGAWIELGGRTYQLLGYGGQSSWSANAPVVARSIGTFDGVSDPSLLDVEPQRIDIVEIDRPLTIAEFAQRYAGVASVEDLVLLNQADGPDQQYPAGTLLKRVVERGSD